MFFTLTLDEVGDKFIEAAERGVALRFIHEKSQASQYSEHHKFLEAGIPSILDQNPRNMHNKLCVFDGKTVLTGSMNPSNHSEHANDEVILFIKDASVAQAYSSYFEKYWLDWSTG
jgi:phosphatidylserine/phosphatidylglycerophosphate/cardiolipin synthase-like enzyme